MPFDTYLKNNGFQVKAVECVCPHCVTVGEFALTHNKGRFIVVCQDGIAPVVDGVCDTSISDEIVLYYYEGGSKCIT